MNKRPLRLLAVVAAFCFALGSSLADPDKPVRRSVNASPARTGGGFTKEERALLDKNMTMQMYKPDEHSRHFIANLSPTDPRTDKAQGAHTKTQAVLCFVFGMEDAQPAREQGKSMAECKYSPQQAHEFLFAQGYEK